MISQDEANSLYEELQDLIDGDPSDQERIDEIKDLLSDFDEFNDIVWD